MELQGADPPHRQRVNAAFLSRSLARFTVSTGERSSKGWITPGGGNLHQDNAFLNARRHTLGTLSVFYSASGKFASARLS
jgi:hypothetical protein